MPDNHFAASSEDRVALLIHKHARLAHRGGHSLVKALQRIGAHHAVRFDLALDLLLDPRADAPDRPVLDRGGMDRVPVMRFGGHGGL